MKVESTGRIKAAKGSAPRRVTNGTGVRFSLEQPASAIVAQVSGTGPLASVDALLAVQGADDATTGRSRGLTRGQVLLERLEEIHVGLLSGGIPRASLHRIAQEIDAGRGDVADPRLNALLDEIELRAQVELAKFDTAR